MMRFVMMMGQGMMDGMISIRVDKPTGKAGTATFEVTNWSRSVLHEMLVVSVNNPTAPLPHDYAQARVPENEVKMLGEREAGARAAVTPPKAAGYHLGLSRA